MTNDPSKNTFTAGAPSQQDDDQDVVMQEYLRHLDLQNLDLNDVELEPLDPENKPGWLRWVIVGALLGLLLWLPSTNYYQLHGDGLWLLGLALATAYAVGVSGVQQLQGLLARLGGRPRSAQMSKLAIPPMQLSPRVTRLLLLLGGGGLASIMLFAMPREAEWQGHGYSGRWFVGCGVAITAGILLGRWLIMQADQAPAVRKPRAPVALPPWVKWATLSVLVAGGLFAALGHHLMSGDATTDSFALGGVGFLVGILGAIWLARRFDEMEAHYRGQKRREKL